MKRFVAAVVMILAATSMSPANRVLGQKGDPPPSFPIYDNGGYPDLLIDSGRLTSSLEIVSRTFSSSACELVEGSIGAAGTRRLLRFDTSVVNVGNGDLVIGAPNGKGSPYASLFQFSPCHGHYHLEGFADYRLLNLDGSVAALGHKQAFCIEDVLKYGTISSHGYTCGF